MILDQGIDELGEAAPLETGMAFALDLSRKLISEPLDGPMYCFICSQTNGRKVPVEYESRTGSFRHSNAEAHAQEAIWYFNTKEFLYQIATEDEAVTGVKRGSALSDPETRAALYARTENGKTVAFEISSPLARKRTPVMVRHKGYQSNNIHDQWIYSHDNPRPFFSYDYRHGLVVDPSARRIGIIAVKEDPSAGSTLDNAMVAQFEDTNLAHVLKYACWTDAADWSMTDEGLAPKTGSVAEKVALSLVANRKNADRKKEAEKSEQAERLNQHKEKAIERARKRGINPDKGDEVFIPPLEEPPYTSYPLTQGMLIEQAAYMAHMSPFGYIKDVLDSSRQWDAYTALRNRWESTGKYDSSFPDFDLLRKKK